MNKQEAIEKIKKQSTQAYDDFAIMRDTAIHIINQIDETQKVVVPKFVAGFYEGEESLVGVVRYGYTDDEIKYFGKVYPPRWFLENRYRKLDFSDLSGLHEESFKVIGDIYQNKELLEG